MENKQLKSFKDLSVWQKASDLATLIYKITEDFPRSELYGISNQMRRAAVSISSNIAEGFKRNHEGEKSQFYNVAYGSVAELESQLEIARNLNFLPEKNYQNITLLIIEVSKMMNGLIKSLNSRSSLNSSAKSGSASCGKSSILNSNKGFTLIELLITIVIFSVIIGLTFSNLVGKRQATDLSAAKQQIAALLREAQSRATNQDGGNNWGVYFGNPATSTPFYSLYASSSYSQGAVTESYRLPLGILYSAPAASSSIDINFSQITGLPSQATTVVIYVVSNAAESSSIAVATSGAITY